MFLCVGQYLLVPLWFRCDGINCGVWHIINIMKNGAEFQDPSFWSHSRSCKVHQHPKSMGLRKTGRLRLDVSYKYYNRRRP